MKFGLAKRAKTVREACGDHFDLVVGAHVSGTAALSLLVLEASGNNRVVYLRI